jgi:hypothetical protein
MHWELGIGCVVYIQDTTQVQSGAWQNLLNRYIKTDPNAEWFNQLHWIGHLHLIGYLHVTTWFITIFAVYIEKAWGNHPLLDTAKSQIVGFYVSHPYLYIHHYNIDITFYPIVYSHMVVS